MAKKKNGWVGYNGPYKEDHLFWSKPIWLAVRNIKGKLNVWFCCGLKDISCDDNQRILTFEIYGDGFESTVVAWRPAEVPEFNNSTKVEG